MARGWFLCEFGTMKISSIVKKVLMALTGLGLVGFLIAHLAGNLLLYKVDKATNTGAAFNDYGLMLEHNPLLPFAEIALALIFVIHVVSALVLTKQNSAARPIGYSEHENAGESSLSSRTMWWTGAIIFAFIVIHIKEFKFGDHTVPGQLWGLVASEFEKPLMVGIYVAAMIALGFHIAHGIGSAFQSLGLLSGSRRQLRRAGMILGWVIALGFASMPLWTFITKPVTTNPPVSIQSEKK